jgi:hypothetical protein
MNMTDEGKQAAYRKYADEHEMKMDDMSDDDREAAIRAYDEAMSDDDDSSESNDMKSLFAGLNSQLNKVLDLLMPKKSHSSSKETLFSSFKAHGDYWTATWTNNLQDREGEWFSRKAILDYVDRVDKGLVPKPALWVWHGGKQTQIGQTKLINVVDNGKVVIVRAVGTFDSDEKSLAAKQFYNATSEPQAMSHGFTYPEGALRGKVYHQFNTFELSVLPPEAAANPYTSFESIKGMKMTNKKFEYMKNVFGEDKAKEMLAEDQKAANAFSELAQYKEFAAISALIDDADETGSKDDSGDDAGIKGLLETFIGDSAALAQGQLQMAKSVVAIKELLEGFDTRLKAVEADLGETPEPASQSDATQVNNEDLEASAKKKESSEVSGFWGQFAEKEA